MSTERNRPTFYPSLLVVLVALLVAPGWASAQSRFSGVVVFGTSLSDPGNAFALSGNASTPPDFTLNPFLIPSAPYAMGGHHFSNGATWIEQYGGSRGLAATARAAFSPGEAQAANFAVGAARAYDDGINVNLSRQVSAFLNRSGGAAPANRLYVIEMGSNDVRDSFQVYAGGGNGGPVLQAALAAIAANIQSLYAAGAREFLVWIVPNIALTPALRSLGPAAGALAGALTQSFNTGLSQVLAQLELALPGVRFMRLDAYRILNDIVANPAAFGLSTVTASCLTPNTEPFICQHADEFLFWDGIHPTRSGHAILARETELVVY